MKIAVAGGTGFLGKHVVAALEERGDRVVVLSRGQRKEPGCENVEQVVCDVTRERVPPEALEGCDALVNLVGIKREDGRQTFESVHVEATRRLIEAAKRVGVRRLIHISVVCSRPDRQSGYHDTKWRAEELVRSSGLEFTILKPGVIFGEGDDMVTHLVKMIRFAAIFPIVGRGDSLLQPVSARDVASTVVGALERDVAVGKTYDVVGSHRMTLREVVRTVAKGTGLRTWIVSTPIWLQRLAVGAMNLAFRNPLSTPAQLRMLVDGMAGDRRPAEEELGVRPGAFDSQAVAELERPIPPLFGWSLRLASRREDLDWLRSHASRLAAALAIVLTAGVVAATAWSFTTSLWSRAVTGYAVLLPLTLVAGRGGWRSLLRPKLHHLATGAIAAAVLYSLSVLVFGGIALAWPSSEAQAAELYGKLREVSPLVSLPLLLFAIIGEEVVWRGIVTLPLAARLGPWPGSLAGALLFALFHAGLPPLLLVAAFGAGWFWSLLSIRTRSLVPALVSHVLWDLAVFWVFPL